MGAVQNGQHPFAFCFDLSILIFFYKIPRNFETYNLSLL